MKRMTKSRGDYLRKSGTQCAGRIFNPARLRSKHITSGTRDMTEFVNHSTLLRRHQQQQEAQGFEQMSHSNRYGQTP
jgi:hypothetical protein